MSTPVSCRLSDAELMAFEEHLQKNGLADRSPMIRKLILREIGNVDSFSLLEKEIELLDQYAAANGKLSRRDAMLKLLTQAQSPQINGTPMTAGYKDKEVAGQMEKLRDEVTKMRRQMVHMIMLAMCDITHNLGESLRSNDPQGLEWKFIEKRVHNLLNDLEDKSQ